MDLAIATLNAERDIALHNAPIHRAEGNIAQAEHAEQRAAELGAGLFLARLANEFFASATPESVDSMVAEIRKASTLIRAGQAKTETPTDA